MYLRDAHGVQRPRDRFRRVGTQCPREIVHYNTAIVVVLEVPRGHKNNTHPTYFILSVSVSRQLLLRCSTSCIRAVVCV